eukprot:365985-Chlamydomonas_euryale.AAC.8
MGHVFQPTAHRVGLPATHAPRSSSPGVPPVPMSKPGMCETLLFSGSQQKRGGAVMLVIVFANMWVVFRAHAIRATAAAAWMPLIETSQRLQLLFHERIPHASGVARQHWDSGPPMSPGLLSPACGSTCDSNAGPGTGRARSLGWRALMADGWKSGARVFRSCAESGFAASDWLVLAKTL